MSFDAKNFLNTQVTAPMATEFESVPAGEYMARIDDGEDAVTAEEIQGKKDVSKSYPRATIWWRVMDEQLTAQLGRDSIRVRQQFFLDVDDSGDLATGKSKNVQLGQIRDALDMNDGSFSPGMLRGAGPALIRVGVRTADDGRKFSEVTRVARIR